MMCVFSVDSEFVCSFVFVSIGLKKYPNHLRGKILFAKHSLKQLQNSIRALKNTLHHKQGTFPEAFPVMKAFFSCLTQNESVATRITLWPTLAVV